MATDRFSFASVETRLLFGLSRLRTLPYTAVSVPRRRISSKFPDLLIRFPCSNTQRRRSVACLSSKQTSALGPADSSASSSSAPEFGLVSTTARSDGSTVFLFGDVSDTESPDIEEAEVNDGSFSEVASEDFPDEDSKEISVSEVPDEDEAKIREVSIKSLSSADIIGPEVVDNEETVVPSSSLPNEENIELEITDEGKENSDEVIVAKSLSTEANLELQSPEKKYQEETAVSLSKSEIASTTLASEGIDIDLAFEAPVKQKGEVAEVDAESQPGLYTGTISTGDVVLDENLVEVNANVDSGHTAELEEVTDSGSNIDNESDSNNVLDTELLDSSSTSLEATSESPQPSTPLDVSSSSNVLEESLDLGTEDSTVLEEETHLEKAASEEEVLQETKSVEITDSINSEELLQSDTPDEGAMIDEALAEETESVDITESINSEELLQSNSPIEGAMIDEISAEDEVLQATEAVDITDSINSEELLQSDSLDEGDKTAIMEETSAEEEVLQMIEAVGITESVNSEELLQSDSPDEGDSTGILEESSAEEEVLKVIEAVNITDSINSEDLLQSDSPDEGDNTAIVEETSAEDEVLQVKSVDITESVNLEKLSGYEASDDGSRTATIDEISQEKDRDHEVEITENNVKEVIEELLVASAIDEHSADTSISENFEEPEKLHVVADESEKIGAISSGDENVSIESNVEVVENESGLPTAPDMNKDIAKSSDTSIKTSISENCEEPEKSPAESGGEEVKDNTVTSTLDTDTLKSPSSLDNGVISNQEAVVEDGEESSGIAEVRSILQSQSEDDILESKEEIIPIKFSLSSAAVTLPHPSKALTGGKDAYFIAGKNWVGVADGAAHWSLKGTSDGLFAEDLMKNCKEIVSDSKSSSVKDVLVTGVAKTSSVGISTVLLGHFDGQVLSVAIVGDSGFIIIRDGTILNRSIPMVHEFNFPVQIGKGDSPSELVECYRIELALNDVIVSATDGLFDNLYDQEIALIVHRALQEGLTPQEIAEVLVTGAEEASRCGSGPSPFSDSAHAAGYVGYSGGKLDAITAIVSVVGSGD